MNKIFDRRSLARRIAAQFLHPSVLDEGLRSGLFLYGPPGIGKTAFLLNDLLPALKAGHALVIYVNLLNDGISSPMELVRAAIQKYWDGPDGGQHAALGEATRVDTTGPTLSQSLTEIVDTAKTSLVLIIDDVQYASTSEDGNSLLLALKAARDAINLRPNSEGDFLLIGSGSPSSELQKLAAHPTQAFFGSTLMAFPWID